MTGHPDRQALRGRRRIAHELGRSERTISRWIAQGLLETFRDGPHTNSVLVADLPAVAAARERDRQARTRIEAGELYKPTPEELLEFRAWRGRGGIR